MTNMSRRPHRNWADNQLQLESLEARQLLAADLLSPATELLPVGDPFAADAVTVQQVAKRAETQSYVPGELLIALEIEAVNPQAKTAEPPQWYDQLDARRCRQLPRRS